MKKKMIIILCCCICLFGKLYALHPAFNYVKESVERMIQNSQFDYSSSLVYKDGKKYTHHGKMAYYGSYFYDSSDIRFVFLNQKWFIGADHEEKTIKVINLQSLKKKLGNYFELSVFDPLLSDDSSSFVHAAMSLEALPNNQYILHIRNAGNDAVLKELHIKYSLNSKIPLGYSGIINVPIRFESSYNKLTEEMEEVPTEFATMTFEASHIEPADIFLFNHSRLIQETNGKATLKRFNSYQTIFSKK